MAYPTLNKNEIVMALYNMIIGQRTFTNNVAGLDGSIVDRARMDGSMYGDTYLFNSADILRTYPFKPIDGSTNGTVPDQANVLVQHVPTRINTEAITLDVFRQIPITIERYLTKRAFLDEGSWSDFVNLLETLLDDTKKVYDVTTYQTWIGTHRAESSKQNVTITLPTSTATTATEEASFNKLVGEAIAQKIADIFVSLKDVSTGFNDLGYYRAVDPQDLIIVWNADYVNYLNMTTLSEVYHTEEMRKIFDFSNVMPAKYFGTITTGTLSETGGRTLEEATINDVHYFAGEEIPQGSTVEAGKSYVNNGNIVCKIYHKDAVPYMSGFQTRTEFINAKALNENHYLTFAHNTLKQIKALPFITVSVDKSPNV